MTRNRKLCIRLKELRKMHGYTQDFVAVSIGVVRQTYSHYESGRRTPRYDVLFKLSVLYHISLDDLMSLIEEHDADDSTPPTTVAATEISKFLAYFKQPLNEKRFRNFSSSEKKLIYYFEQLSDAEKNELIEIAKLKYEKEKRKKE